MHVNWTLTKIIIFAYKVTRFNYVSLCLAAFNLSDWWLAYWISHSQSHNNNTVYHHWHVASNHSHLKSDVKFYLIVYGCIGGGNVVSKVNPLSANPTKWSNTFKQFVDKFSTNYLSAFDHFAGLALKVLKPKLRSFIINYSFIIKMTTKMKREMRRLLDYLMNFYCMLKN